MLITTRSPKGTIIYNIYCCSPRTGNLLGGGHIFIYHSIQKLQYVIENEQLNQTKFTKTAYGVTLAFVF